jgi:hypothetical protein
MKNSERSEAIAQLRKLLKPGDTVYTILRHCSASGMSRVIDLAVPVKEYRDEYPPKPAEVAEYPGQSDYDAKPRRVYVGLRICSIGWLAAKAMDDRFDPDRYGIKIGGCGQDMGFSLVYNLGATLWPKGTRKPHSTRNGEPDTAGGYALNHKWI